MSFTLYAPLGYPRGKYHNIHIHLIANFIRIAADISEIPYQN